MAIPIVAALPIDPVFDFSDGSEEFSIAQTDPQRSWASFRDVLESEKVQLADLFQGGIDQGQVVRVPALTACVRKINRFIAMSLAMARQMEEEKRVLESTKSRIEEAFVHIKLVLAEVNKKHKTLIEETRNGAGIEFQRLSNEGSSMRDDLLRTKTEAEASIVQLGIQQDALLKAAQAKFVQIEAEVKLVVPQTSSVGGVGGGSSGFEGRRKSVFEFIVIKDYPVLGEDKRHFREWHYKLKAHSNAILGPLSNLTKWMDIAEKDACSVKKESDQDPFPEYGAGRTEAAADIEAIMINTSRKVHKQDFMQ
jgi:hypothetical protein